MARTTKGYAIVGCKAGPVQRINNNGGAMATQDTFTPQEGGLINSYWNDTNPITQIVQSCRAKSRFYGSNMAGLLIFGSYNGNVGHVHVSRPLANSPFATKTVANQWVGTLMCTTLAGVSSTILMSMGAYPKNGRRWPAARTWRYTQYMVRAGWNRSSGAFLTPVTWAKEYFGNNFAAPGRDDSALNSSVSNSNGFSRIPGEFAYLTSSKIPTRTEYSKSNLD